MSWEGWHASHALDVRLVCNMVLGRKSGRIPREATVSGSEYACERIVDTFHFRDLFACITFSGDLSYFSGRLSLVLDVFRSLTIMLHGCCGGHVRYVT